MGGDAGPSRAGPRVWQGERGLRGKRQKKNFFAQIAHQLLCRPGRRKLIGITRATVPILNNLVNNYYNNN